jgi:dihydrodipicolinate synthase/N-acetylneuraminate lyase
LKEVQGIITPMVTPFLRGEEDRESVARLLEFMKESGVAAAFPMGSTGLFTCFGREEHARFIELVSGLLPAGMRLLAGVGRNAVDDTLYVAKRAADSGADAAVVVTPYYIRMSQRAISDYYAKVADSLDLPVIVYNIPQFTGNPVLPDTLASLAERHPNIAGVKDSSGDLRTTAAYVYTLPQGVRVYQGQDDLLLPSMALGVAGGVCGTTNFSSHAVGLWRSGVGSQGAREANAKVIRVMKALAASEFPKGYYYLFQKVVAGRGKPSGYLPFPVEDLSSKEEDELYGVLRSVL